MRDQVFISYSHSDNRLMEEFLTQLSPCLRSGSVTAWSDKEIAPGDKWFEEIQAALQTTSVAILLVSADFLASDFIHEHELGPLLKEAEKGGLKILWVQLRACAYNETPLKDYQAVVSPPGKPLAEMKAERAQAWVRICEEIKKAVRPSIPTPASLSSEPVRGEPVRRGLAVLGELLKLEEAKVRRAMVAFPIHFQEASQQIEVLSSYKDLHDLLHRLQHDCYEPMTQEATRFPDDGEAGENLQAHARDLQGLLEELHDLGGRGKFSGDEPARIKEELDAAMESLGTALAASDVRALRRALWSINHVLAVKPPMINVRLNDAARALNLEELAATMETVCRNLRELGLRQDQVSQLDEGVKALSRLAGTLATLVGDHDRWQWVEQELRRIEGDLARSLDELENSWPHLKMQIEPLCNGNGESWAQALRSDGARLEVTLATQDEARIRHHFRSYRRQAERRFFRVDDALKRQCYELRQAGEPLAMVLRVLA